MWLECIEDEADRFLMVIEVSSVKKVKLYAEIGPNYCFEVV